VSNHNGRSRVELERQATVVRSRLIRAVEELERRGHDALDLRLQLRTHLRRVAVAGALLMFLTVGSIGLVMHRVAIAAERRRLVAAGVLRGRWRPPPPPAPARRGFFAEIGRSFAIAAITTCAMIPVRRFAAELSDRSDAPRRPGR
jgi:hypothetical protein